MNINTGHSIEPVGTAVLAPVSTPKVYRAYTTVPTLPASTDPTVPTLSTPKIHTAYISETPENIGEYFPLSKDQIARAKGLDISEERIGEMRNRYIRSKHILNTLHASDIYKNFIGLSDSFFAAKPLERENFDLQGFDINNLLDIIFTPENLAQDIPFIAMYYGDPQDIETHRITLAILHTWKYIRDTYGNDHENFGKIIDKSSQPDPLYLEIWKKYTTAWGTAISRPPKGAENMTPKLRKQYNYLNDVNNKHYWRIVYAKEAGTITLSIHPVSLLSNSSLDPQVFSSMGYYPAGIGQSSSDIDIRYLEEIYVLGTESVIYGIKPYSRLLKGFVKRHKAYFTAHPELLNWKEGITILSQINAENIDGNILPNTSRKSKPSPKTLKGYTAPKPKGDTPVRTPPPTIVDTPPVYTEIARTYPVPTIHKTVLIPYSLPRRVDTIFKNIPPDTYVWVKNSTENIWVKYAPKDELSLPYIPESTYSFFYAAKNATLNPDTDDMTTHPTCSVYIPRRQVADVTKSVPDKMQDILVRIAPVPTPVVDTAKEIAESIAIQILVHIERDTYTTHISPDGQYIDISFPDIDTVSLRTFPPKFSTYTIMTGDEILKKTLENTCKDEIQNMIQTVCMDFLADKKQKEHIQMLVHTKAAKQYIDTAFGHIVGINTDIGNAETLAKGTRYDNGSKNFYAGMYILRNGNKKISDNILQKCKEYGVHVSLEIVDTEVKISISDTKYPIYTAYILSSTYTTTVCTDGIPDDIKTAYTALLQSLFLAIGYLGKATMQPVDTTNKTKKPKNTTPVHTPNDILSISAGTYIPPDIEVTAIVKKDITTAHKRYVAGTGKVSTSAVYDNTYGYMQYNIHGKKGYVDIENKKDMYVVLRDENIRCVGEDIGVEYIQNLTQNTTDIGVVAYARLEHDIRMKKYWIQRMIATIDPTKGEKSPYTGQMKGVFDIFWNNLDDITKQTFVAAYSAEGSITQKCLEVYTIDNENVYDTLISTMKKQNVQLIYASPYRMPVEQFLKNKPST